MPVVAISTSPLSVTGASHLGNRSSFSGHVFDVATDQLLRGSTTLKLTPKALLLLRHFVHHPGRVLTKDALMAAIWGPTVVTENSLVQLVVELRTALCLDAAICLPRRWSG
jgi:DNA-binding winged helix-turn-helix (wHTH) protein